MASPRVHAPQLATVVAVGVAAYSNTFAVPFTLDDVTFIVRNPAIRDLGAFFRTPQDPGRALTFLTFALNEAFGGSLAAFHAVNLAIHLATALCVYALGAIVVPRCIGEDRLDARRAQVAGWVAALLFVAHPIQTQAVTYVYQRLASLVALFYVAAVVAYGLAATSGRGRRAVAWSLAAAACTALALLTKQNAVTVPIAMALLDVCFLGGGPRDRARRLAPFLAVTAAVVAVSLAMQAARPVGPVQSVVPLTASTIASARHGAAAAWFSYVATQPRVVLTYLRLLLLPIGQNLDWDFPVDASPFGIRALVTLLAVLGGGAAMAWRRCERSVLARVALFGIGWSAVALSVESLVPLQDALVEHRVYLPSVGPFLLAGFALAAALKRLAGRAQVAVVGAIAACVVALAAATYARNEVWRDPVALWSDAVRKSPGKARPHYWLAQALLDRADRAGALPLLERASSLGAPPQVSVTLGATYVALGRLADGERAYRRALEAGVLTPTGDYRVLPGAHLALATLLVDTGRVTEACEHFAAELAADPGSRETAENVVACRFAQHDVATGVALAERLVAEDPRDAQALCNLARGYEAMGEAGRARDAYGRFLAVAGPEMERERVAASRWLADHPAEP